MKLYGFPPSPNTQVQAVAAHLGIALEFEFVDITKGLSHTPQFLLNPTGRTPVLVDGDFALSESDADHAYVAGKRQMICGSKRRDPRRHCAWQFWQVAHWHKGLRRISWESLVKSC
jgi:glutathione S-transferase